MKRLITALLTASALLPAGAQAQRARFDADAQIETRSERADRGDRQPRADRPDRADRADYADRTDRPDRADRADRPDRADRAERGQYRQRADAAPSVQPRRPDVDLWRDGAPETREFRTDRGYGNRDSLATRDRDRRDFRGTRQDAAQGRPGWQNYSAFHGNRDVPGQRYGYDNRGGYGNGYATRSGTWSRDWRSDHRYDWNRYRTANRGTYRLPRYYAPGDWGYGYRRFSIGVTLSSSLWGENYWIDDPYSYRLPDAYGPYRWVRYYDDALLIDLRTGRVVDTVYGIFY